MGIASTYLRYSISMDSYFDKQLHQVELTSVAGAQLGLAEP
jgi:hypothetical protein